MPLFIDYTVDTPFHTSATILLKVIDYSDDYIYAISSAPCKIKYYLILSHFLFRRFHIISESISFITSREDDARYGRQGIFNIYMLAIASITHMPSTCNMIFVTGWSIHNMPPSEKLLLTYCYFLTNILH